MAEILVFAKDNTHSDHPDVYKKGMPVVVFEDGHNWGKKELIPPDRGGKFVRIKIPGLSVEEFNSICKNHLGRTINEPEDIEIDLGAGENVLQGNGSPSKRSALLFDLDKFNNLEKTRMYSGGSRTIPLKDLDNLLKRKAINKTLGDLKVSKTGV